MSLEPVPTVRGPDVLPNPIPEPEREAPKPDPTPEPSPIPPRTGTRTSIFRCLQWTELDTAVRATRRARRYGDPLAP